MPESVTQTNIEEIANMLVECRDQGKQPVLFLGARAGGAFRNVYLYKTLQQFSLLNFDKLSSPKQFGECYHVLRYFNEGERHVILANALNSLKYYRHEDGLLSGLVKAGFFKVIITTNIDTLLEQSFSSWGMQEPDNYRVYSEVNDIKNLSQEESGERYIIKVFGDLNSLRYNIENSKINAHTNAEITRSLQPKLQRNVVVIGYDPVWDHEIERAFPLEGNTVWYINESPLEEVPYLETVVSRREGKQIKGKMGSYSNFLKTLYMFLGEKVDHQKGSIIPPFTPIQSPNKEKSSEKR